MKIQEKGDCQIFGAFGIMVQALLGVLSFTSLVVKRYYEERRRSWKIFLLDSSKQAFSALLAHTMNLFLAFLMSETSHSDDCVWYFITLCLDVSLGMLLSLALLKSVERLAEHLGIEVL